MQQYAFSDAFCRVTNEVASFLLGFSYFQKNLLVWWSLFLEGYGLSYLRVLILDS